MLVVRDDEEAALKVEQRVDERLPRSGRDRGRGQGEIRGEGSEDDTRLDRVEVEVVGRLVEQQDVRLLPPAAIVGRRTLSGVRPRGPEGAGPGEGMGRGEPFGT